MDRTLAMNLVLFVRRPNLNFPWATRRQRDTSYCALSAAQASIGMRDEQFLCSQYMHFLMRLHEPRITNHESRTMDLTTRCYDRPWTQKESYPKQNQSTKLCIYFLLLSIGYFNNSTPDWEFNIPLN